MLQPGIIGGAMLEKPSNIDGFSFSKGLTKVLVQNLKIVLIL